MKILRCFVLLSIISTIKGQNSFSSSEKTNEIYFTYSKERQPNGSSKIKIIIPLKSVIENEHLKTENEQLKTNYLDLEKRKDVSKNIERSVGYSESLVADSFKSKGINAYHKNIDEELSAQSIRPTKSRVELQQESGQSRYKKEVGKHDANSPIPSEYRQHDPITGSYSFGYRTQSQYREEIRTEDGTVRGNYGWVDASGKWHHTTFISDENGYRIITPANLIDSYHTSESRPAYSTLEQEKSTYSTYNKENEVNSYKQKIIHPISNRNQNQTDSVRPQQLRQENPLLANLKQKFGIKGQISSSSSQMKNDKDESNSTYISYVQNGTDDSNNEQTSENTHFQNKKILVTHTIPAEMKERIIPVLELHSNDEHTLKKTHLQNKQTLVSHTIPTTAIERIKPIKHETITRTNLQDNFFDKLPLKQKEDGANPTPPLDKPLKMFSNYLTKWPDMSFPTRSDQQILNSLQGLSGRSNSFLNSEPDFESDFSTLDESKIAKSIYDSPVGENSNPLQSEDTKGSKFGTTEKRIPTLYPKVGTTDKRIPTLYPKVNSLDNVYPNPTFLMSNQDYNLPSMQMVPFEPSSKDISMNHALNKNYVLIIPVFYGFYIYNPLQNMNIAKPTSFQNQFPSSGIKPIIGLTQPTRNLDFPNNMQVSSSENIDILENETENESFENEENNKDYLLLSDEFQEVNGSITNDPAFVNIQDFFTANESNSFQNVTFEKPINIFEVNETSEIDENKLLQEDDSREHDSDEIYDDQDDYDNLTPSLVDTIIREQSNTHKEMTFKLSSPLVRNSFPTLLNRYTSK